MKPLSLLFLFFMLLSFKSADETFFRINKLVNGNTYLWGTMDISGNIIIAPKFEGLGEFRENTAFAKLNKKWGVINKQGEFILKPEFEDVREFENNLAWVIQNCSSWIANECDRGKWGLINRKGKILIPPKYDGVLSEEAPYTPRLFGIQAGELFRDHIYFGKDGYARVYTVSGDHFNLIRKYGIVNNKGKEIIPPNFNRIGFFQNDIAPFAVTTGKGIFYGLLNTSGKILLEPACKLIESLVPLEDKNSEVIWAASYYDENKKVMLHKILSRDGKEISSIRLHQIHPFKDGIALARETNNSKWGFIDMKGEWKVKPIFKHASDAYPPGNKKPVYPIEINGKKFYKDPDENVLWFEERRVDPYDGEERTFWNFADLDGNNIVYCRSFEKGYFSGGVSWISLRYRKKGNGHIIYKALINEKGKELTEPVYLNTLPFRNGIGAVQTPGGSWGYINKEGKTLWWIK
jgi:hypothetical protein